MRAAFRVVYAGGFLLLPRERGWGAEQGYLLGIVERVGHILEGVAEARGDAHAGDDDAPLLSHAEGGEAGPAALAGCGYEARRGRGETELGVGSGEAGGDREALGDSRSSDDEQDRPEEHCWISRFLPLGPYPGVSEVLQEADRGKIWRSSLDVRKKQFIVLEPTTPKQETTCKQNKTKQNKAKQSKASPFHSAFDLDLDVQIRSSAIIG